MKIHIGSDHAGYELKEILLSELNTPGRTIIDYGCNSRESCDYPQFAAAVCKGVKEDGGYGILICGTGLGMSMAANRFPGIRAALCPMELMARLARKHNNANILCLGARMIGQDLALAIVSAFLETSFEGGRHERRIAQLETF